MAQRREVSEVSSGGRLRVGIGDVIEEFDERIGSEILSGFIPILI